MHAAGPQNSGRMVRSNALPIQRSDAMRHLVVCFFAVLVLGAAGTSAEAQYIDTPLEATKRPPEITDAMIDKAIERGVTWVLSGSASRRLGMDGGMGEDWGCHYVGRMECMIALLLAHGGANLNDPAVKARFDALMRLDLKRTYTTSVRIMALAKLMPRLNRKQAALARKVIKRDASFLVKVQMRNGAWGYPSYPGTRFSGEYKPGATIILGASAWDFSNMQFAILALSEAARVGVIEVPPSVITKSLKKYLTDQRADGGWTYGAPSNPYSPGNSYGAMTAAGVASLYLIRDQLAPGQGCPCRNGKSNKTVRKVSTRIDKGLDWLGRRFTPSVNPGSKEIQVTTAPFYWLFSCERAGLASGVKYLGKHDWYAEGARFLLSEQQADGGWQTLIRTTWAVCFLAKGRSPILLNKLRFKGEWNTHPRDAANLVRVVSARKEQPMRWQVINLEAPLPEWHDAPILYVSAQSAIALSGAQKKKLRTYTDSGGTLLFEATCGQKAVDKFWRQTCTEIWPEFELKKLAADHPLWTADERITKRKPLLEGISDGVRTFVFYSPKDLSCYWQTLAVTKNESAFVLGVNLYSYATDHGRLRGPLEKQCFVDREPYKSDELMVGLHRRPRTRLLKHGGDWHVTRHYGLLTMLEEHLRKRSAVRLQVGEPASTDELKEANLLWLTGRTGVTLTDNQQASLKAWLAKGGFLIAEAAMGDPAFDKSFAALAESMGLKVTALEKNHPLITGKIGDGSGHDLTQCKFRRDLLKIRMGKPVAELYGLYLDSQLVGIYSPHDVLYSATGLRAFGCRGYQAPDARAVAVNMVIAATNRER
jgi:uncharacterized protein DUF4159